MEEILLKEDYPLRITDCRGDVSLYVRERGRYVLPNLKDLADSSRKEFRKKLINMYHDLPSVLRKSGVTIRDVHMITCQAQIEKMREDFRGYIEKLKDCMPPSF